MKPGVSSRATKGAPFDSPGVDLFDFLVYCRLVVTTGPRGGSKGKRQALLSSGTAKLPQLLAAASRKTEVGGELAECWENMQAQLL